MFEGTNGQQEAEQRALPRKSQDIFLHGPAQLSGWEGTRLPSWGWGHAESQVGAGDGS